MFVFQLMELHQQAADILLQDAAGCTLLHHAVEAGSKEILKYLIDNGESQLFEKVKGHSKCYSVTLFVLQAVRFHNNLH